MLWTILGCAQLAANAGDCRRPSRVRVVLSDRYHSVADARIDVGNNVPIRIMARRDSVRPIARVCENGLSRH